MFVYANIFPSNTSGELVHMLFSSLTCNLRIFPDGNPSSKTGGYDGGSSFAADTGSSGGAFAAD